jgi:hypothetical protein
MPTPLASPYAVPLFTLHAWWGAASVLLFALAWGFILIGFRPGPRCTLTRCDLTLLWLLHGLGLGACVLLLFGQRPHGFNWTAPALLTLLLFILRFAIDLYFARKNPRQEISPPNPEKNAAAAPPDLFAFTGALTLALFLLLMLAPAFLPSVNYDVLEYHLGVVPHWFAQQRITPLPHVFYSAQPCATELCYGFAALAEGTPWGHAPGALQWCLALIGTLIILRALAAWELPRPWRPWCALLVLTHPLLFRVLFDRLTDFTGVFYLAGGLWVAGLARQCKISPRLAALSLGLLSGFAVGAKWTHSGTVAAPLLLLACWLPWLIPPTHSPSPRHRPWLSALQQLILAGAAAFCAWLPWGAWLWRERTNPFAPFLANLFPSTTWSPTRLSFLLQTHGHTGPLDPAYWANLYRRLVVELPGLPLIALAFAALLIFPLLHRLRARRLAASSSAPSSAPLLPLALGLLCGVLLWGQLIHAADRFLAAPLLLSTLILALVLMRTAAARNRLFTLIWLVPALFFLWQTSAGLRALRAWNYPLGREPRSAYLQRVLGSTAEIFAAANQLPSAARMLTINEARRFYFSGDVDVVSVFDANPLRAALRQATSVADLHVRLRALGYTHVLINEYELERILHIHTPSELLHDARLQTLLQQTAPMPQGIPADAQLVTEFAGTTEFATTPLTSAERALYLTFYQATFTHAIWRSNSQHPSAWIAPL